MKPLFTPAPRRARFLTAVALALLCLFGGAFRAGAAETAPLVIAGTGDSEELLRTFALRFMRDNPDTQVEVPDSVGSTGGIRAVAAGKAELARTARPLRDEEKAQGLAEIVFAKAPVVFAVNPSVSGVESLTARQVLELFSGEVTDWSALGGPAGPIHKVCRETPETSRDTLNAAIPGFAALGCQGQAVAYSTPEAVKLTADHPGAIGYFAKPAMTGSKLRALAYDGVPPSPENLARERYPLFIPFALVYKPPLSPLAARFIQALGLPDGRTALANYGCLPLPVKIAAP
ncbi:MAG: substrate-binding domain-containing protein [Solidesulfovibrio sp. DCME]|uniref:substrate-binding domain-containing protein n=1 Tax=Solidesulfovibrio sp. DCME TaxID=3447380 RepID=UPI003D0A113A